MPQSSRVIVTRAACAFHASSQVADAAAVQKEQEEREGAMASASGLCIRQGLLGLAPACKHLRTGTLQQFVRIADAEMMCRSHIGRARPRRSARPRARLRGRAPNRASPPSRRAGCAASRGRCGPCAATLRMLAVNISGSASAIARLKRSAKLLTVGQSFDASSGTTTCMPLPPDSSGKVLSPRSPSSAAAARAASFTFVEVEADVGIEVEHQPVGIFDLVDLAAPAVEFDRSHLDAGEQPADVVEVEIILGIARPSPRSGSVSHAGRRCPCRASGRSIRRCALPGSGSGSSAGSAASTMISGSIAA